MLQEGVVSTACSRHVFFVGDFSEDVLRLVSNPSAFISTFALLADMNIECYSLEQFQSQRFVVNANKFSVVITDPKIQLQTNDIATDNTFYIACNEASQADVFLSRNFSPKNLLSAINLGFEFLSNKHQLLLLSGDIATVSQERKDLSEIGIALSAEKDLEKLLTLVLEGGRKLGNCEAASLYLLRHSNSDSPELLFKLTQNSKIDFDFEEKHFPLTNRSLAGYVALTGEILNIADAYYLSENLPYRFDKSFNKATGYRTCQMLVLPMSNHKGKIIGVLQFINNKDKQSEVSPDFGFTAERKELLLSLSCQAAVSIDNSQLIENIQLLFEGFVAASVKAIESRDPVTSGHSFRVAEYTAGLAKTLDATRRGRYRNTFFSTEQLRELRYASLLHDFGKVGVKEDVLLKANKLADSRLHYLSLKIEWQKQWVQKNYYHKLLMSNNPMTPQDWKKTPEFLHMQKMIERLSGYQNILLEANKPSLLDAKVADELKQLFDFKLDDSFPYDNCLLNQKDFLALYRLQIVGLYSNYSFHNDLCDTL